MISDISILNEMIKESVKEKPTYNNGKCKVTLREPKHPDSNLTVSGMPDEAIVIKADEFASPDSVFNGSQRECKRADYVIIAEKRNKKVVLCIEMKAGKNLAWEIVQQLKGARCFVEYCRHIGQTFWNKPDFLKGYVYRFVSFKHISIAKRPTRFKPTAGVHDNPEDPLRLSGFTQIRFDHIAGLSR